MQFRAIAFLFGLLTLFSACKKDPNSIEFASKEATFLPGEPILFDLSGNVFESADLPQYMDVPLIEFEPELPGSFYISANNQVSFTPSNAPQPGITYTGKLTPDIIANQPEKRLGSRTVIQIKTPKLALESAMAEWWDSPGSGSSQSKPRLNLHFNYPVSPGDLSERMKILCEGEEISFTQQGYGANHDLSFFLEYNPSFEMGKEAALYIDSGLVASVGGNGTAETQKLSFSLPSMDKLKITSVTPSHDGVEGTISVRTTQKLIDQNLEQYIRITPKVPFVYYVHLNELRIKSEQFELNTNYEIEILEGIEGSVGGKLEYGYAEEIRFGTMRPTIRFVDNHGTILSKHGLRNIKTRIISVEKVNVSVRKIYENNMIATLGRYRYDYYSDDPVSEDYSSDREYYDNLSFSDEVFSKTYSVKDLPKEGNSHVLKMDFADKLNMYDGMYLLEVSALDGSYAEANKVIAITDMGIVAKVGEKNIHVFVNSLKTAQPVAGAKIDFIGKNNQVVGTATTDAAGHASMAQKTSLADGFEVNMVTAAKGSDFSYLITGHHMVNSSRFDVGGKSPSFTGMEAFIYGERNIYRPGEEVHLAAILRNNALQPMGEIPVKIRLVRPDGKVFKTIRKMMSAGGATDASFAVPASAPTGGWSAEILSSTDRLLNSTEIKIEEFMPDRIKVELKLDQEVYGLYDSVNASIASNSFFGPPSAGRNYEVSLSLQHGYFYSKEYPDYDFSLHNAHGYLDSETKFGTLSEEGQALESFHLSASLRDKGLVNGNVHTAVFDETGRPVNRKTHFKLFTQPHFYGIGQSSYYINTGQTVRLPLIAVNTEGKSISTDAQIVLYRYEYATSVSRSSSYFRYDSKKVKKELVRKSITIPAGGTDFTFVPELSGNYILEVRRPGSNNAYVSRTIWAYGRGQTSFTSFKVNREGNVDVIMDKEKYAPGDVAKILFKGPFSGRMLVTVESGDVDKYFTLETDKRVASLNLPITGAMAPNVYVTATLIKPHGVTELPLTVAHGAAPVMVEDPNTRLKVGISAAAKTESHQKQTIRVKTAPYAYVTLSAVDEGILQVGKMTTPDPHGHFYQRRSLSVNWYDHYRYLLPEVNSSSTGGDGAGNGARLNPMTNRRIKLVSFWSGTLRADANGNVQFPIEVPQFSGSLRIMAVAHKGRAFGHAEAHMVVADPVVISAALPRFLSPGDQVDMTVFLSNTTDKTTTVSPKISIKGPLKAIKLHTDPVEIQPNSEQKIHYTLVADNALGEAGIDISVSTGKRVFKDHTDISIRPSSPLQKRNGAGTAKGGETAELTLDTEKFMPQTVEKKLIISRSPLVQFTKNLEYLIEYPHGCVEQTVSRAFPQLYYADLVEDLYAVKNKNPNPRHHIQQAIQTLRLRQLYNGGLTYWPAGGRESWWGTVFATHFLLEARKAGYEVDGYFLDNCLGYLRTKLNSKPTEVSYVNATKKTERAPREIAYSLFVLALAGEADRSLMNYYRSRGDLLTSDSKYLLAAAYALSGDKEKYRSVLPQQFEPEGPTRSFGGAFSSHIRNEAIALYAILESNPDDAQIPLLAKHVSQNLQQNKWLNTQESVFSFLAMGKLARQNSDATATAEIWVGDKKVGTFAPTATTSRTLVLHTDDLPAGKVSLRTQGTGKLYYFWESAGVTTDGSYDQEDQFIRVRRNFYTRTGEWVDPAHIEQNELIIVEVALHNLREDGVENIAISDLLPACFEIENPRINHLPDVNWIKRKSSPDFMDIRDDRMNYFVDLGTHKDGQNYYYLVRAVSPGTFNLGPVAADAMYNAEYHSYHGAGTITVKPRGAPKALPTASK